MRTAVRVPAAAPGEIPFPEPIRLRLRRRILALDYAGCSKLLQRLLGELGYEDVRPAGRTTLKGYNRPGGGGWDLCAALPAGVGSRRVAVRLKHAPREHLGPAARVIHQRCVDELRGACLRAGASEGILASTGEFSLTARRLAAQDRSGVAPVRLLDGDELVELLLARRVGVREAFVFPGRKVLEVDEGFFKGLGKRTGPRRPAPSGKGLRSARKAATGVPGWRVTVLLGGYPPRPEGGRGTGRSKA